MDEGDLRESEREFDKRKSSRTERDAMSMSCISGRAGAPYEPHRQDGKRSANVTWRQKRALSATGHKRFGSTVGCSAMLLSISGALFPSHFPPLYSVPYVVRIQFHLSTPSRAASFTSSLARQQSSSSALSTTCSPKSGPQATGAGRVEAKNSLPESYCRFTRTSLRIAASHSALGCGYNGTGGLRPETLYPPCGGPGWIAFD